MAPDEWKGNPAHLVPRRNLARRKCTSKLEFNWDLKPVNDVIAKIPVQLRTRNEWITAATTHRRPGFNGAPKIPIAGRAPLLEEARALSLLLKQGWKPPAAPSDYCAKGRREPMFARRPPNGLEAHADELRHTAAVYINTLRPTNRGPNSGPWELAHTLNSSIKRVDRRKTIRRP